MIRDFEELDYQKTSLGDLLLRRRRILSLDGLEVYEVKLGEEFLMSSLFHAAEDALSHLALAELDGAHLDVVVGGLGLGYTAVAALEHHEVASVLVVEALEPVIGWHERGLVPLGQKLRDDHRCRLLHADFFALARSVAGFDRGAPGRQFHAVLLDIDHSPQRLLHPDNATFYQKEGFHAISKHLHPGGVFAMWSDDPPDEDFLATLDTAFASARAHIVSFENPLLGGESASTVYVACMTSM